jgi:hypothetical protein
MIAAPLDLNNTLFFAAFLILSHHHGACITLHFPNTAHTPSSSQACMATPVSLAPAVATALEPKQ